MEEKKHYATRSGTTRAAASLACDHLRAPISSGTAPALATGSVTMAAAAAILGGAGRQVIGNIMRKTHHFYGAGPTAHTINPFILWWYEDMKIMKH